MNLLDGKIAFLTGGNGQLGTAITETFLKYGAKVASIDLDVKHTGNDIVKYYKCDVTDKNSIRECLDLIKKELGTPNVLINNAGIDSPPSANSDANLPFEFVPKEIFENTINVNTLGVVYCCQELGLEMRNNGGSIVNIGSIYGVLSPNHTIYEYKNQNGAQWFKPSAYSISKSANINLTRYLATYWAGQNIRVNMVSPAGIFNNQDEQFLNSYLRNVPMNRMANVNEIANAIAFLCSDMSSYVTGQNLIVDGGLSAW